MPRERVRSAASALARDPFVLGVSLAGALAALAVFALADGLFPYHSINHDEGVYLQQAAMLLDGKLWLEPPVPEAVRPWFFVRDGGRLYSKYQPVTALLYAPALALGVPRVALALLAGGSTVLVGLLGRAAFDRQTGLLAAPLFASAPLFLVSSAVFLSYAPTTFLNLAFAVAYVRTHRRASRRAAVLAGLAVGLAFFARPYTAVLFALPFVAHAGLTLAAAWYRVRSAGTAVGTARALTARLGTVAALGVAFVAVSLAYNRILTGDPLVFPYQAFAPADGIGFGHREILDHEREYTPALALRANRRVLWQFFARWGPLGPLGSALAAVGVVTGLVVPALGRARDGVPVRGDDWLPDPGTSLSDRLLRVLLAGVAVSVVVGNVFFWGNLNVLADVEDPTDGLIAFLGPFYHFDLLVPAAVFGAAGAVAVGRRARATLGRLDRPELRRGVVVAAVLATLVVAGGVESAALADPLDRNADHREDLAQAYEPFAESPPTDALVFVPTPYGGWLNHPFQWLRNDPAFDGERVYVLDRGPAGDAASLAAFPDRTPYRFTYRGSWPPDEEGVRPVLERLAVREGDRLVVETRMGVPLGSETASVRLAAGGETAHYGVERVEGGTQTLRWELTQNGSRPLSPGLVRYSDRRAVPVDGPTLVVVSVTFVQPGGATVTYRQAVTVLGTVDGVRVLWPPEERVCRLTPDCGHEGTYVPGGDYPSGVSLSSSLTANGTT